MAMYQASKELTKFIISGLLAVGVDLVVYYALSQSLGTDLSKTISFMSGMIVTYNLNKYWTWRQNDKNNKRLLLFIGLYTFAMVVNVVTNKYALELLPNNTFLFSLKSDLGVVKEIFATGIDKILAFMIATVVSASFTFFGQKYWLFKKGD